MDEATSSLDKKTEDFIVNQLRELKRKKTLSFFSVLAFFTGSHICRQRAQALL